MRLPGTDDRRRSRYADYSDLPGVYVQEIPSGVRTISGVATSITAFIGRALRGPVDEPVTVNSFADFERTFGGLWVDSPMSYAVRDFFLNGGGQAVVVRLYKAPSDSNDGRAELSLGTLKLAAVSPGLWGKDLKASIDQAGIDKEVAERYEVEQNKLFNLRVELNGQIEQFANVTLASGPR